MPYFIYRIEHNPNQLIKKLTLNSKANSYKDAKREVKQLRESNPEESGQFWKIVFAESELEAEDLLHQKREKPVLMEWEK